MEEGFVRDLFTDEYGPLSDEQRFFNEVHKGSVDDVMSFLDAGINLEHQEQYYGSCLHLAAASDHPELIQLFLDKGLDPNVRNSEYQTPLHDGCSRSIRTLGTLLRAGADIHALNEEGSTALTIVAGSPDHALDENATYLLDAGADPTFANDAGWTPLRLAVYNGRSGLIRLLIERGVTAHDPGKTNVTSLHFAASHDLDEAAAILIEHGAIIDARTNEGETPLDWAKENASVKVFPLVANGQTFEDWVGEQLTERGEEWAIPMYKRIKEALLGEDEGEQLFIDIVQDFGKRGIDFRFPDDFRDPRLEGHTLPHIAVQKASIAATQAIANLQPDLSVRNSRGLTAVELAYNFTRDPWDGGELVGEQAETEVAIKAKQVYEILKSCPSVASGTENLVDPKPTAVIENPATPSADESTEDAGALIRRDWSSIWLTFGSKEFTFEEMLAEGYDDDDANEVLTGLAQFGIIETVGLRRFRCVRSYESESSETNFAPDPEQTETTRLEVQAKKPWWKLWR